MTAAQFAMLFGVFIIGVIIGVAILALFVNAKDDSSEPVSHAANEQDAVLMNYLERAECNLFFNPTISAWGLLDGQDKMLATAHSVRATLARAMVNERAGA